MADCVRRADGINWVEVDGDVVAVNESTGDIHVLQGAAAAIWQLLDGEPLDGFEVLLAETFEISVDEATLGMRDAVELLDRAHIIDRKITPT